MTFCHKASFHAENFIQIAEKLTFGLAQKE